VEASLNNFDLLTAALKDDKELTIGVAKELIKRPAFTSETYKEKPEYKTLQELGIYTKESEIKQSKEGKNI
jgi:hypothetical protein